jgi:hypothetical protein
VPSVLQINPDAGPDFAMGHNRVLFRNELDLYMLLGGAFGERERGQNDAGNHSAASTLCFCAADNRGYQAAFDDCYGVGRES